MTYLVSVNHKNISLIIPNRLTSNSKTHLIIFKITSNLQLEVLISLLNTLCKQKLKLLLTIPQPTRTGSVSWHSLGSLSFLNALLLTRLDLLQQADSLFGRDGISDVAEVNAAHELLGSHVRDDAPDGLVEGLGPEIPESVDDCA
jgi:hypothetical protein